MDQQAQSFANHVKYDPRYHFFLVPVLLINLILAIYYLVRFPSLFSVWLLILALAAIMALSRFRIYALRVQDRVIRLEERLRLMSLLPEPLRSRVAELSTQQLIGLRFASDQELLGLVQRALDEKLSVADIKKSVVKWRPDYSRI
jgi:hypothetical protein